MVERQRGPKKQTVTVNINRVRINNPLERRE
jgi:hypothetical protein